MDEGQKYWSVDAAAEGVVDAGETDHIRDMPDKVNLTCLIVRGSVTQKTSLPCR